MTHLSIWNVCKKILTCVLLAGAAGSALHASAQQVSQIRVPFSFESGAQVFPAGTYRLELRDHVVALSNRAIPQISGFALANPETRAAALETGKAVFHRHGGQFYLGEIWFANDTTGRKMLKSKAEKESEIADKRSASSTIEVALNALPH